MMLVVVKMIKLVVVKIIMRLVVVGMVRLHPKIVFSYQQSNHLCYYLFKIFIIIFIMLILIVSYIIYQILLFLSKLMLTHLITYSQSNLKTLFLSFFHPIIICNDLNLMNVQKSMRLFNQFIVIIARFSNLIDLILNMKVMVMGLFLNIFKVVILVMIMKVA